MRRTFYDHHHLASIVDAIGDTPKLSNRITHSQAFSDLWEVGENDTAANGSVRGRHRRGTMSQPGHLLSPQDFVFKPKAYASMSGLLDLSQGLQNTILYNSALRSPPPASCFLKFCTSLDGCR